VRHLPRTIITSTSNIGAEVSQRTSRPTQLAGAMLRGDIGEGDTVKFLYDRAADAVRWEKKAAAEPAGARAEEEERAPRGREREGPRPAAH
jgi:hypothetical protein